MLSEVAEREPTAWECFMSVITRKPFVKVVWTKAAVERCMKLNLNHDQICAVLKKANKK